MSAVRITHYVKDDLIIKFPVTFEAGAPFTDLTGATIEALVQVSTGGATLAADTITPGATEIVAQWAENRLSEGVWTGQLRITKSGVTQTTQFSVVTARSL